MTDLPSQTAIRTNNLAWYVQHRQIARAAQYACCDFSGYLSCANLAHLNTISSVSVFDQQRILIKWYLEDEKFAAILADLLAVLPEPHQPSQFASDIDLLELSNSSQIPPDHPISLADLHDVLKRLTSHIQQMQRYLRGLQIDPIILDLHLVLRFVTRVLRQFCDQCEHSLVAQYPQSGY
jgi:hypothetical protein